MKRLAVLLLICSMLVSLLPHRAYAAENPSAENPSTENSAAENSLTEMDLTAYLQEISAIRGFEVSEDNIAFALYMADKSLEDFKTVEELKAFLGEVILADNSNLSNVYNKYNLDLTSIEEVLKENGEELKDYVFLSDLDIALDFYIVTKEVDFDTKLEAYLAEISAVRGFTVTKEDINALLEEVYSSIDDFETVADLSSYMGEVINADLSNLDYFIENYGLDKAAVLQLLEENDLAINDFIFMNEVEKVVINSMGSNLPDFDFSEFMDLLSQIGITENEIANLENHFILNEEYFSSEEGMAIFEDVISRLEASLQRINEKTLADEDYIPSEAEITEFVSLYEELISAFKLKASISMVKDGVETKYSLVQLLKADLDLDAEYKIELYNEDSELLLDAVITAEFIKDNFGEIIDKVDDLTETVVKGNVKTTVKGAKLPKTASNNIPMALLGIVFTISGVVLLRKLRIKNGKGQGEQI
ncbi:MAG: hypothetical protein K0S04_2621 [Herbinix sp.]|nr:hypothetical protein [Herbinix sp.]